MPDAPPHAARLEEFERRVRDQMAALAQAGLTEEEARLIATRRAGRAPATSAQDAGPALGLAAAAALAIKLPALAGVPLGPGHEAFYARNLSLFVLPLLTIYFAWTRRLGAPSAAWLLLPFAAAAVVVNGFPFPTGSQTGILAALHLPIALWLAVGLAYAGGRWLGSQRRMDFVRFSGELCIYYVLIALGGGVLTGVTATMFNAIDVDAEPFVEQWLVPCGAMGAVIIGSWLVDSRPRAIEHMAPVLTRLFTPLFTAVLALFLLTMAWTGRPIAVEREILIGFDLLLALVVGLVLFAASARDPHAPPHAFDRLQLALVVSALLVDALALAAIVSRISEFGFTPNRVAALGENLILFVNLAGSAWLYAAFLRGRAPFAALERWQIAFLPVYAAWAALVVVVFPPLFGYA